MLDDCKCSSDDKVERILQDPNAMPKVMQLEYLKRITDNFSDKRLHGEGGFGKVYKGELQNGKMIAVKKFNFKQLTNPDVQEKRFMNEVFPLMSLRHPNIVRCVGYCFEKSSEVVKHNGIFVLAESQPEMLLCLEYLTMGSLDKHLQDESSRIDWRTCYKIIKGVCCGLHYLHEECRSQINDAFIIHMDLKPANILLDENMVPKVADFGLSKLFYDKKTQTCSLQGTLGYMAPEYICEGKISTKADIYSLGVVIIEIITGSKADLSNPDIEQIINKWRNRSAEALSLVDCQQIRSCLEIGKCCIKSERNERPTTGEIIKKLSLESIDCSLDSEEGPLRKKTKRSCDMPHENQEKEITMKNGIWVFKNGVVRLVENGAAAGGLAVRHRKALVHMPSGQVVRSYAELESELKALGWERYYEDPALYQFHKRGSPDLISLPADFARFSSVYMYDIVIKNRESFRVVDV